MTKSNGVTQVTGRKSKLTPDLINRFESIIEKVYYPTTACDYLEINGQTAKRWLKDAYNHVKQFHPEEEECTAQCSTDDVAKRSFLSALKRAQAKFNLKKMENISNAGKIKKYWMANAWQLERTQPDKFGLKTRVDNVHSGEIKLKPSITVDRRQAILKAAQESLKIDTRPEQKAIEEAEIVKDED